MNLESWIKTERALRYEKALGKTGGYYLKKASKTKIIVGHTGSKFWTSNQLGFGISEQGMGILKQQSCLGRSILLRQ